MRLTKTINLKILMKISAWKYKNNNNIDTILKAFINSIYLKYFLLSSFFKLTRQSKYTKEIQIIWTHTLKIVLLTEGR